MLIGVNGFSQSVALESLNIFSGHSVSEKPRREPMSEAMWSEVMFKSRRIGVVKAEASDVLYHSCVEPVSRALRMQVSGPD
jgi:hypothetical protein